MNMRQIIAATGVLLAVLNGTAQADISIGLMATLSGPQGSSAKISMTALCWV